MKRARGGRERGGGGRRKERNEREGGKRRMEREGGERECVCVCVTLAQLCCEKATVGEKEGG